MGKYFRRQIVGLFQRLLLFFEILLNHRAEMGHQPDIQTIEPHHRLGGIVEVIMPGPVGCGDEIAFEHREALALDDGVSVGSAFNDKTDRRRGVAVRRSDLAGLHQLHRDMHGVGHAGGQSRIAHLNCPPPGLSGGDQLAGPVERLHDLFTVPQTGLNRLRPFRVFPMAL